MTSEFDWLPLVFIALTGLAFFIYAVLDGFDLGVGVLLPMKNAEHRHQMINSIGPFWDANETWLVLAIGLLLIAFPAAHSLVLQALYLPITVMLIGLILRGIAFDFRVKGLAENHVFWEKVFKLGSLMATLSQGYMLGHYVMGFDNSISSYLFALLSAICVTAGYAFIGACWLVLKSTEQLQIDAARWARLNGVFMAVGLVAVSISNLWLRPDIAEKWLTTPQVFIFLPLPILFAVLFLSVFLYLRHVPHNNDFGCWYPFTAAITLVWLQFQLAIYGYDQTLPKNG